MGIGGPFTGVFLLRTLLLFYLVNVASLVKKMGLNDLTLEKLISEINGYKEKMRAIHEDYGRASQDLQDRINVLGYNLNEHLKQTKDQMATTPQRLLNLETKYVTGEVNDSEYMTQRQEFKGLLENNLRSIEEIKQMIDVLSHIETKPLQPGEFKQAYPAIGTTTLGESWSRTALLQGRPTTPIPTQSSPSPAPVVQIPRIVSEAPSWAQETVDTPQPQNNGNGQPIPQTNNAFDTTATVSASLPTLTVAPAESSAPIGIDASANSDETLSAGPTQDVVEDIADALVVKVVDDIPILEASAAVATTETSPIQSSIAGSETIPSLQPSGDISSPAIATPSQFYKVVCPKCGADVPKPAKVWELKGGKSKKNVLIGLFQCQDCRVKFREALTREIL